MPKYSSLKEIEIKYNRKKWQLERRYRNEVQKFENWDNIRKIAKADTSKEDDRQDCMELIQESCRMQRAIDTKSIKIKCCSCDYIWYWRDLQWWHKESRKNKRVCIHPMNVNPQCWRCNNPLTKPKDEQERIAEYLIELYWFDEYVKFDQLCLIKWVYTVPKDYWSNLKEILKANNLLLKSRIRSLWFEKPK